MAFNSKFNYYYCFFFTLVLKFFSSLLLKITLFLPFSPSGLQFFFFFTADEGIVILLSRCFIFVYFFYNFNSVQFAFYRTRSFLIYFFIGDRISFRSFSAIVAFLGVLCLRSHHFVRNAHTPFFRSAQFLVFLPLPALKFKWVSV